MPQNMVLIPKSLSVLYERDNIGLKKKSYANKPFLSTPAYCWKKKIKYPKANKLDIFLFIYCFFDRGSKKHLNKIHARENYT